MTTRNMFKTFVALTLVLLVLFPVVSFGAGQKVRVKVASANVRLKPALDAIVVGKARQGQVLVYEKKTGDWYLVSLPPDEQGNVVTGFIHSSVVVEVPVEEAAPVVAAEKPKAEAKPEATKASPPAAVERPTAARKVPVTTRPAFKRLYLRLGGGYGQNKLDFGANWTFDLYHEQGYVNAAYSLDASGVAIDAGLGFLFTRNVGIEASFIPARGKIAGAFDAGFPHPFYFSQYRTTAWNDDGLKYSANEINLNLLGRFPLSRRLAVYLTAGGTYFLNMTIDSLSALYYGEGDYPYLEIDVMPEYQTYSKSTFGFNGGAGVDFFLSDMIAVNVNGRYSSGTATFEVESTTYEVRAGGIRATAGLKVAF
ncbi:MAG: outer membrane beta-barrel protein [Candidatus Aminicenantes bacterium]|nr:outer membrane beta-barrel protein [Candidatus Aminicenantes bacterium]